MRSHLLCFSDMVFQLQTFKAGSILVVLSETSDLTPDRGTNKYSANHYAAAALKVPDSYIKK